jgi:hypothetical protein
MSGSIKTGHVFQVAVRKVLLPLSSLNKIYLTAGSGKGLLVTASGGNI